VASDDASVEDAPQSCKDCGIAAPATETNYTLISARHGWRLALDKTPEGRREAVWRCPNCWAIFRGRR
jgi:hypothetical protein